MTAIRAASQPLAGVARSGEVERRAAGGVTSGWRPGSLGPRARKLHPAAREVLHPHVQSQRSRADRREHCLAFGAKVNPSGMHRLVTAPSGLASGLSCRVGPVTLGATL